MEDDKRRSRRSRAMNRGTHDRNNNIHTYKNIITFLYLSREFQVRSFLSHHRVPDGFPDLASGKSERAHWRSQPAALPSFVGREM
jgi:hypothetical protein